MSILPPIYQAAKQVLGERKYIVIFFVLALFFFWLFVYIPVITIPGNTFIFQLTIFRAQDYLLLSLLALLVGLNFSLNIFSWRQRRKTVAVSGAAASGGAAGLAGTFAAMVGTATCASCLASLFGFIGLGFGSVAFVLKYQTYFLLSAITLVLISLYFSARKINKTCPSC